MTLLRNRSALVVLIASVVASAAGLLTGLNTTDTSNAESPAAGRDAVAVELAGKARGTSIEPYQFDDIDAMAATSKLIVHGTVNRITPGRSYGSEHDQMGWSNVEVAIDETLAGKTGPTVTIEELTTQSGTQIALNGLAPLRAGDTGFFFLRPGEGDTYVLASSQGRYLESSDRLHGRIGGDDTVSRTEQLSPDGLRAAVARARDALSQGRLRAQRPAFGEG